ncbi:MAG TPA: hypothetical protein VGP57_09940, partial [Actinoplanes sp.]|nr:hypothetical protein [Actinoplanes sp.]
SIWWRRRPRARGRRCGWIWAGRWSSSARGRRICSAVRRTVAGRCLFRRSAMALRLSRPRPPRGRPRLLRPGRLLRHRVGRLFRPRLGRRLLQHPLGRRLLRARLGQPPRHRLGRSLRLLRCDRLRRRHLGARPPRRPGPLLPCRPLLLCLAPPRGPMHTPPRCRR